MRLVLVLVLVMGFTELRLKPITTNFLSFQSEEIRDLFLENFRDYIEKIKPLYS